MGYFVISGSGTLTATESFDCTNIRLASGVTIRCPEDAFIFAAVRNASGTEITPTTEGGYKVYVGNSVVTVWIKEDLIGSGNPYVVYNNDANNDAAHYDLTATGDTWNNEFDMYRCYTAPLATGATTYTVWNGSNSLASGVSVSGGEILIYGNGGKGWRYK